MSKEKYQIVPFAGDNYNAWEFRLKSILRDNGVIEAIKKEDFSKSADKKQLEAKAQAVIIAATADSHLENLKDRSAYQMIKSMEDSFKKKDVDVATGNTTEAETTVRQLITRPKGEVEESHFLQALKILKVQLQRQDIVVLICAHDFTVRRLNDKTTRFITLL
ncbi:unnamed protein product [Arctia plantaginis]|uniref:DUF4219 domain-containing protein n=1 Tax=Arctia plantaginis TaxID=874455 RepID=A0A8S1B319_ARCPL|nr:unnamed protein product [Arctia plantaginis]